MIIREATIQDCPLLCELIRALAVYEKLEHEVRVTPELLEESMFGATPRAHAIIAEYEGKTAGFALYFFNFSTFLGKAGLYVEDIYVHEAYRGKGIGKTLFTELASIARRHDCGRMEWWALNWNTPAIDFYLAHGAEAMNEWTVFRLTAEKLQAL